MKPMKRRPSAAGSSPAARGDPAFVEHAEVADQRLQPVQVPRRADDDIGVDPSSIDQARRIAVELVDRGNHLDQSIADGDEHLLVDDRGRTPEPDSAAEHALRGLRQARIGQIAKAQVADRIPSLGLFGQ